MLVIWQPLQGQVPPLCPLNPTPVQRVGEENPSWWSVAWFLLSISIDQLQSVSWQGFNTPIQVTLRCPDFLTSESCCEVPSTNSSHNKKMHEKFGSCPWTRCLQNCSRLCPCWCQPGSTTFCKNPMASNTSLQQPLHARISLLQAPPASH